MATEKHLDLIDRSRLLRDPYFQENRYPESHLLRMAIMEQHTVDAVEVVHGQWIYKWDAERDPKKLFVRVVCSACNLHTGQKSNYCPNCGAKMDGERS